ncbi:MAG: hypothetical protein FIA92_08415 [Chloroflexi bacterium]|nr:hypothetical protein [Chloroflexota bacterium]
MTETGLDLAVIRARLQAEQRRLLELLGEPIEGPGQMTYGSQAAAATHVFEQQRDLALRDQARSELANVRWALEALDRGDYGTCVECGRPIAPERLEAIPWVSLCIDDARKRPR